MDHLGVEVETTEEVTAATARLAAEGLPTATEEDTACCYAVQDKVWVTGPGGEPWEVYVVKADADALDKAADSVCCAPAASSGHRNVSRSDLLLTSTRGYCPSLYVSAPARDRARAGQRKTPWVVTGRDAQRMRTHWIAPIQRR